MRARLPNAPPLTVGLLTARPLSILLGLAAALLLAACGSSGGSSGGGSDNSDLFTSAGFQEALDAVSEKAGDDAPILKIQINPGGAEFQIRDGEQATGFIYSGGDLHDVDVQVIGGGSLEGQDFPLNSVQASAIDRIDSGVREVSGIEDIKITVMTLEKGITDGRLRWVIGAEGNGRTGLVFDADPDGSNVTSPTGSIPSGGDAGAGTTGGTGTTGGSGGGGSSGSGTSVQDAQAIADCIAKAGGDVTKIQACTQ